MRLYYAIVSVPLEAASDDAALDRAGELASSLPGAGGGIGGHLEILWETPEGGGYRCIDYDPGFVLDPLLRDHTTRDD